MVTHKVLYNFYIDEDNTPRLKTETVPNMSLDDAGLIAEGITQTPIEYIDKAIDIIKNKSGDCYTILGLDWCAIEVEDTECEVWCLDEHICTISTDELYMLLVEWREFFFSKTQKSNL